MLAVLSLSYACSVFLFLRLQGSSVSAWPIACADSDLPVSGAGLREACSFSVLSFGELHLRASRPHCNAFSYSDARKTEAALGSRPHGHPPRKATEVHTVRVTFVHWLEYHQRAAADPNLRNCTPLPDVIKSILAFICCCCYELQFSSIQSLSYV